ncbi:uncharacterized protein LOC129240652 [Anastrepha obliqua]|uniref:uncharacterized protein LOC129240652 n=1 Tax=Anastrepha obliqua TaxID=95512 RepID=UPI00240A19DE|nr:uncharacterized protein LOC129240652 [Anastrepha obliqua]
MAQKSVRDVQQHFAKRHSKVRSAHMPVTILVLVVQQEIPDTDIFDSEIYTCHHIISKHKQAASGDDRTFVDEDGNTYNDWKHFKQENKLECGIMVAPLNGNYSFDDDGKVKLEFSETPVAKSPTIREVQQDFAVESESFAGLNSKSNMIYVLITDVKDFENIENVRKFTCHPVIRSNNSNSEIFVDEDGKSYMNWECFKRENKLPCGIMVAPLNGHYSFDGDRKVELEFLETPSLAGVVGNRQNKSEILERPSLNDDATIREAQLYFASKSKSGEGNMSASSIYVMVTKQMDIYNAMNSREFSCHFVLRKDDVITENQMFVDDNNIEYTSWNVFICKNKLPQGIMVAPLNGIYSFDENGVVELEIRLTPVSIPTTPNQLKTIGSLQQHFADMNKYGVDMEMDSTVLHILVTSNEYENVLEAKEFEDFCVKRKKYQDKLETEYFYEDESCNKYPSWSCYLKDNDLPDGIMVAPHNGEYTFDNNGNVKLDIQPTPTRRRKMRTILEVQQEFADNSGFNKEIIWDLLSANQCDILRDKITKLIPDQKRGQNRIEETRKIILDSVWSQRKYTNGNSLSAIIYVLVTDCEDETTALSAKEFSCHPVFRTRKCTAKGDSSSCCMIFVDELGRVYQNWKTYLANNELPSGMMIAPGNGIYTTDGNKIVELEIRMTPNGSTARKALNYADTTTAVAGFGAAAIPVASLMVAVTPPLLICASAVCATTAAYSTIRSVYNLVDRKKHEQSIGLSNSQARNSWLGVGAGVLGMGAAGATKVMTAAAAAGQEISLVTELFVNGMNISSIVLSGSGVANGILDIVLKYRDDEDVSHIDVLQLAASLVLFTHSVRNFRLASTLINETRHATIQDYRKSLSNRQRKMFDKMAKETVRIRGESRGNVDIIRSVNDMPSKQYLNDLYKINKKLNEAKVRPSFGSAGDGIVLNNEVSVNAKVLRNNVQHNQGPNVLNTVTQPIPESHPEANAAINSRLLPSNNLNQLPQSSDIGIAAIVLPNSVLIPLAEYGKKLSDIIANSNSFEDIITTMAEAYTENAFRFLMKIAQEFVEKMLDSIRTKIHIFISAECILYRIFLHCQEKYIDQSYEYLADKKDSILNAIKEYFQSLNPNSDTNLTKCDICIGSYSICTL